MSDLHHCHPLRHQGESRMSRLVQTLQPDTFRLDERTIQELIVEAHRFGQTLRFFDETDIQPEGAYWERFWEVEILTYLAVLAAKDTDEILRVFKEQNDQLEQQKTAKSVPGSKKVKSSGIGSYKPLLEFLQKLAFSLEDSYQKLVRIKHPLQTLLLSRIRKDNCCDQEELEGALVRLIGFHKGADSKLDPSTYSGFFAPDKRWGLKDRVDYDAISANPHFSVEDLRELFNSFYNTWLVLKNAAQDGFDAELARMELPEEEEYRIVQPHIILFLVFLRLFRYAQESLNELGTKHLAYYYEEVLGLTRRGEVPDEVFLLFELAKDFDQHFLEKGTEFLAGKDKNGRPLLFETLEDWVLRPAQVADKKNTWIDLGCGGIHGNPDVSKLYANGKEKPNETADSWRSMGDDRNLPDGELGFAIASPQLIMREGKRVIDITLKLKQGRQLTEADATLLNQEGRPISELFQYFQVYLSSEEAWIVPEFNAIVDPTIDLNENNLPNLARGSFGLLFEPDTIHVRVILERDDPPVDFLGEKLAAEAKFDTSWPIVKVLIHPDLEKPCPTDKQNLTSAGIYEILRTLVVEEAILKVGAWGIRENLIIQSDQGVFDGTQKVFPFGPVPAQGNQFYIGSTEVFQKALDTLKVHFKWIDTPNESFKDYYSEYEHVGFEVPDPAVLIDFIDRAEESTFKKITRVGKTGTDNKVTGTVSDVFGNSLAGVDVMAVGTVNSVQTNADGNYDILIADAGAVSTKLKISKGTDDFEELFVDIENAARINVVLFPKKIQVTGAFEGKVSGRVTNVYGDLLPGVGINSSSTPPVSTDSKLNGSGTRDDNYELSGVGITETLKFTLSDFQEISNVGFNGFTTVDVIMRPEQKIAEESGDPPTHGIVSGTILSTKDTAGVEGATISAEDGQALVKTNSLSGGAYTIHMPGAASSLRFLTNVNLGPVEQKVNNAEIDVRLFPHLHLKKNTPFTGNISGKATNVQGGGINDVTVKVDGEVKVQPPNNGTFELSGLFEDSKIEISKAGFESLAFLPGKCSRLEVKLFPDQSNRILQTGGAQNGTITVKVTGLDGTTILDGVTAESDSGNVQVQPDGTFKITGLDPGTAVKISVEKSGFKSPAPSPAPVSINKDVVIVLLEPKAKEIDNEAGSGGTIEINIIDLNGNPVPKAKFVAKGGGTMQDVSLKGNSGSFKLNVEANSWEIRAYDDGSISEVASIDKKDIVTILLSKQIARLNPVEGIVKGKISDVSGNAVSGAPILSASGVLLAESKSDGRFEIINPPAAPFNFTVKHGAFEPLTIEVTDNSELEITLTPKKVFYVVTGTIMDVKKIPIAGATYGVKNTGIQKKSGSDGFYDLPIPADLASSLLFFEYTGYESVDLDMVTQGPTFSQVDIRLYFVNLNYFKLIQGDIVDDFSVNINALNLLRDVRTQEFDKYSPTLKRGFIRFTLTDDDFRHSVYSKVLTWHALDASGVINITDVPEDLPPDLPNPPYTPAVNGISLDYSSEQVISGAENDGIDQFYHLLPFNGHKWNSLEAVKPATVPAIQLIYPYMPDDTRPVFISDGDNKAPYAPGNLFIGIAQLQPGGTLSLLFQIEEGTEKEPESLTPAIHWSYLAEKNSWLPFKTGQILKDTTNGLTRTGMIQFTIPTTAVKENTMLNPEYYWLRAAAKQADPGKSATKVQALPSISDIKAQVVQARFKNAENELSHLGQPLPAGTISKLVDSSIAVKKVDQPLESFGGRLPESMGMEFYYRVSERLRHKDRAVTVWDYEHLLLERFPEVAAAKCIQHTRYQPPELASERAPGYVTVAAIPDLKKRKGAPWPEPRFTSGALDDMRKYLAGHTNLCVAYGEDTEAHLQLVNPLYEKVDIRVVVAFKDVDEAYFKEELAKELTYYISTWLADPSQPPVFGRTLEWSAILQFIEERPYVDYVMMDEGKDFQIRMQVVDMAGLPVPYSEIGNGFETTTVKSRFISGKICPSTARSILVAGDIKVGSTNDSTPVLLPAMPTKKEPSSEENSGKTEKTQVTKLAVGRGLAVEASSPEAPLSRGVVQEAAAAPAKSEKPKAPPRKPGARTAKKTETGGPPKKTAPKPRKTKGNTKK